MTKTTIYKATDFADNQDEAVQYFLHYAYDHMTAAKYLNQTILLDSAAYLCNIAFELLLKAIHLSENGTYRAIHNLIKLNDELTTKVFNKNELPLVKIIDKCSLIRYPIDKSLLNSSKILRLGKLPYGPGTIGSDDLEKANKLFLKIWLKLEKKSQFKNIIHNIYNNPYKKGNRILMQKPKEK